MPPTQWQLILDELCDKARQDGVMTDLETFCSEEDMVKCFLNGKYREKLLHWIRSVHNSISWKKCDKKAHLLREDGNKYFRRKQFCKALNLYSESIKYAQKGNEELALSLANRSAALTHMEHYEEALRDIDLALINGYPKDLLFKLYQRKGNCLMQLKLFEEAIGALQLAEESLKCLKTESAKEKEKACEISKSIENSLTNVMEKHKICDGKRSFKKSNIVLPTPIFGEAQEFPFASKALQLRRSKMKGRYVVADSDLSVGDVLFVEKPYACVLLPEHYKQRCHYCCHKFKAPVPCWECSLALYCSEECRLLSWNEYHKWECYGGLNVVDSVGIAHLGLRIVLKSGCAAQHQIFKEELSTKTDYKDHYSAVYHLVTNLESMTVDDRAAYALTAACLVLYLECFTNYFVENSVESDTEKYRVSSGAIVTIGGLILRHICQLVCNGHAITAVEETNSNEEYGGPVVESVHQFRVATAIYPSASMMNHSCDPSIINSSYGNTMIIKAYKDIKKGEEVFNCYGPTYRTMSLEERQETLKNQYHFVCTCSVCQSKSDFEEQFKALQCLSCHGPVKENDVNNNRTCPSCGEKLLATEILPMVNKSSVLYMKGCEMLEAGQTEEGLKCLVSCLSIQDKYLYKTHKKRSVVLDTIAKYLSMLGDYHNSISYLTKTLPAVDKQYGSWSIEMAYELQKLSDIMICDLQCVQYAKFNADIFRNKLTEAEAVIQRTIQIFQLHYGPWNISLQSIIEKQNKLLELKATLCT